MLAMWLNWQAIQVRLGNWLIIVLGFGVASQVSGANLSQLPRLGSEESKAYEAFKQEKYDEAERLYRSQAARRPNDASAAFNLGAVQLKKGDLEGALKSFKQAQQTPDSNLKADAYYNEAAAHFLKKDFEASSQSLKEVLSYAPEHKPAKALQQKLLEQKPEQQQPEQQKQESSSQKPEQQKDQQGQNNEQTPRKDYGAEQASEQQGEPDSKAKNEPAQTKDMNQQQGKSEADRKELSNSQQSQGSKDEQPSQTKEGKSETNPAAQLRQDARSKAQTEKPTAAVREAEKTLRKVDDKVMRYLWEAPGGKGKSQQEDHPW